MTQQQNPQPSQPVPQSSQTSANQPMQRKTKAGKSMEVNALFGESKGLTEDMKRDLEQRGAIFGDRPPVLTPR